jgi:YebC/PmpR family DNA-binding regulatory protein
MGNIKHRKGRQDAARGKLFAKLAKAIEVAARQGGGDPGRSTHPGQAIAKAKAASMPNDNIERAIKRGTGEVEGAVYEEIWYEGYGPGGVALYVQILTDNRNRAASDVRSTFTRNNGNLGEPGSVGYLFEPEGARRRAGDEDDRDAGRPRGRGRGRPRRRDGLFEVVTAPGDLPTSARRSSRGGCRGSSAEVTQLPTTTVPVEEPTPPGSSG